MLMCGGCVKPITTRFGIVFRLDVKDGVVLDHRTRRSSGDSQPNCAVCDPCWVKEPRAALLSESQALESGEDHVFAYVVADSNEKRGEKQWSSIECGERHAFVSRASLAHHKALLGVIDDMHRRQVEFATQQALCDAGACDCARQPKPWPEFDGAIGVGRGVRVSVKRRGEKVPGVVVYHEHPPHAHWHTVIEDGSSLPVSHGAVYPWLG